MAYYQQVGRAGRATENADVLLLPGVEDEAIWQYFATSSMPSQHKAEAVLQALPPTAARCPPPPWRPRVDLRRTPLELLLKVLDVDGAVRRVTGGWVATGQPWVYDADRYERIGAARQAEQNAMLDYERTTGCRMEFLQRALDDDTAVPCGRCDNCTGALVPHRRAAEGAQPGRVALTGWAWPSSRARSGPPAPTGSVCPAKGRIDPGERVLPGRALARLTDLGWGNALRDVFAADTPDAPASAAMLGRLRAGARRVGLGRAARRRWWRCRPGRIRCSWPRWPPSSAGWAACRTLGTLGLRRRRAHRRSRRQQRLPARQRLGRVRGGPGARRASPRPRPGAAGRRPRRQPLDAHRRRPAAAPWPGRPRCCRSRWRCAADQLVRRATPCSDSRATARRVVGRPRRP